MGKKKKKQFQDLPPEDSQKLYEMGKSSFKQQNYLSAIKTWRKIRENAPMNLPHLLAQAHFRYALSLERQKKISKILSELHLAIQNAPEVAIYHYHLGLAYHQKGDYKKAINSYQGALQREPDNDRFLRHLDIALLESGKNAQGIEIKIWDQFGHKQYQEIQAVLQQNSLEKRHHLWQGITLAMQHEYSQAKKCLQQVNSPEYVAIVNYYLAAIYAQEKKYSSAVKHFELVQKNFPDEVCLAPLMQVYKQQAGMYQEQGQEKKAKSLWNKIAKISSDKEDAEHAVLTSVTEGYHYVEQGNISQAMRNWKRLINQGIEHPMLLQNYAIACDHQNEYEKAIEIWEKLVRVWQQQLPKSENYELQKKKIALVYRRIGELASQLDDYLKVKEAYSQALEYTPKDTEIRLCLIEIELEEENYPYVFRQLRQLNRQDPKNMDVLELMITAHLEVEEDNKALYCAIDILKLNAQHQEAKQLLRTLGKEQTLQLFLEENYKQAIRLLESFLQVDELFHYFHILLGQAFLFLKQEQEAAKAFSKVIEITDNKELANATIGKAYMFAGQTQKAENYFQKTQQKKSKDPEVLIAIATGYFLHDSKKAQSYLHKLGKLSVKDSTIFEEAVLELRTQQEDQADIAKFIDLGIKIFPNSFNLLLTRLMLAMQMHDTKGAQKIIHTSRKHAKKKKNHEMLDLLDKIEEILFWKTGMGDLFYDE